LQNPSEIKGGNKNNLRHAASRHPRNIWKECLKNKINDLATYSRNKDIEPYKEEYMNLIRSNNQQVTE
jgi:hypothetical protein